MYRQRQIQQQTLLSAYERKTVHDVFDLTMEWLEKCIEIGGYYPDWQQRKQIHDNNIKRTDIINNPAKAEQSFSSMLVNIAATLEDKPPFLYEELKEEFYKWISATRIDVKNCPEKLKNILFGINEILEGNKEKIKKDTNNRRREFEPDSDEYMKQLVNTFGSIQNPLQNEREQEQHLAGKRYDEITLDNKFSGDVEQGKEVFNQLANSTQNYRNFHFFPQNGVSSKNYYWR
jgi:hypothetical protein